MSCSKDNSFHSVDIIVEEPSTVILKSAIIGIPCPGDFDGDGKVDLSVKNGDGVWSIDFKSDEFSIWNITRPNIDVYWGGGTHLINDYDGDGIDDFFVFIPSGFHIDYSGNGFGNVDVEEPSNWLNYSGGYVATGDYDGDGKTDLSVKTTGGQWFIDYSIGGFGSWNVTYNGYGGSTAMPYPRDYDGDGKADLSVVSGSSWLIDYSNNGFGRWDQTVN